MNNNELDHLGDELNLDIEEMRGYAELPNSTAVLVLGILSIPCCCFSLVGVILGVIGLILAKQDLKKYHLAPHRFSQKSYKNLKAGQVCAIIGVALGSIGFVSTIVQVIVGGLNSFQEYLN